MPLTLLSKLRMKTNYLIIQKYELQYFPCQNCFSVACLLKNGFQFGVSVKGKVVDNLVSFHLVGFFSSFFISSYIGISSTLKTQAHTGSFQDGISFKIFLNFK